MQRIYDQLSQLPPRLLQSCAPRPWPSRVLMCSPQHFDVIDEKNPHMASHIGSVDTERALRQWQSLRGTFEELGIVVEVLPPEHGCEDMVFCANPSFCGLDGAGRPTVLESRMRHSSRQREVGPTLAWFERNGYRRSPAPLCSFEGGGDALWHPQRALIWGGVGPRTEADAYDTVARVFDVTVLRLQLQDRHFYHLDTCLCALDENTALIHPPSFDNHGLALIRAVFEHVIECPQEEAESGLACNATALANKQVVIDGHNPKTVALLEQHGWSVHQVDTSEFRKSGGSVYCMKSYLY